jgi:hypothetical protein
MALIVTDPAAAVTVMFAPAVIRWPLGALVGSSWVRTKLRFWSPVMSVGITTAICRR